MKKVLAILICTLTLNAHATEMCARDDTVVVPLDATIEPADVLYLNIIEWMYGREFSYGIISMAITMLSLSDIREINNNSNISGAPNELLTSDERLLGREGWYNDDKTSPDNERVYCYYQMTHPMLSRWILLGKYPTPTNCINNVSWYGLTLDRRKQLFNAILPE